MFSGAEGFARLNIAHPVNIYVYRNGVEGDSPKLVHISTEQKKNMKTVMKAVERRLKLPVGYPIALHNMNGTKVKHSYELEMYNNYVVVTNIEKRFKCVDYGKVKDPLVVVGQDSKHVNRNMNLMRPDPIIKLVRMDAEEKRHEMGQGDCPDLVTENDITIGIKQSRSSTQCCSDEVVCVDEDDKLPEIQEKEPDLEPLPTHLRDLIQRYSDIGSNIFKIYQLKIKRDLGLDIGSNIPTPEPEDWQLNESQLNEEEFTIGSGKSKPHSSGKSHGSSSKEEKKKDESTNSASTGTESTSTASYSTASSSASSSSSSHPKPSPKHTLLQLDNTYSSSKDTSPATTVTPTSPKKASPQSSLRNPSIPKPPSQNQPITDALNKPHVIRLPGGPRGIPGRCPPCGPPPFCPPPCCPPPCCPPPPWGCFPPPPPCCLPPPGCLPPPCQPPPGCFPPPFSPVCNYPPCGGGKQIIRVPKGSAPPCFPGLPYGDGSCPKPCYNNCNFYTSDQTNGSGPCPASYPPPPMMSVPPPPYGSMPPPGYPGIPHAGYPAMPPPGYTGMPNPYPSYREEGPIRGRGYDPRVMSSRFLNPGLGMSSCEDFFDGLKLLENSSSLKCFKSKTPSPAFSHLSSPVSPTAIHAHSKHSGPRKSFEAAANRRSFPIPPGNYSNSKKSSSPSPPKPSLPRPRPRPPSNAVDGRLMLLSNSSS